MFGVYCVVGDVVWCCVVCVVVMCGGDCECLDVVEVIVVVFEYEWIDGWLVVVDLWICCDCCVDLCLGDCVDVECVG